ncbi:hypothetical protein Tsubulata_000764 [Turnera subulata]|uniref:DUF4283 domain-containing protein n=1 Tax=Turnera subulata TaxID=218843 RepID=A0A9Q0GC63_9ROSI|nr:hypothetical protein Tsubulata_000764 [Turnera subulata]
MARTYVVGKVLGERRPHLSQIRSQMQSVWYIKGDLRIIPKMNNIFLIGFELEKDKKKVLKGSPWHISNMHFCLKGWFPDMILSQGVGATVPSKKRKVLEEEVIISPIQESARRTHTGTMNAVAELITDLHDASPIHASASKPSWKRLARKAKINYQPTTVDLVQACEAMEDVWDQSDHTGRILWALWQLPDPRPGFSRTELEHPFFSYIFWDIQSASH